MLASKVPSEQWPSFFEQFNREHAGHRVRVERHQPGAGIIYEVDCCVFEKIHDDCSGDHHRIGVIVGEPQQNQETFFMTDPLQLLWCEDDICGALRIAGTDGRFLIVRLLQNEKAAA
jgi:hypothetical protein